MDPAVSDFDAVHVIGVPQIDCPPRPRLPLRVGTRFMLVLGGAVTIDRQS